MNAKLTLTVDKAIIQKAKKIAAGEKRSLSAMVENYLKTITNEKTSQGELSPFVDSLRGAFKMPKHLDYKKERINRLTKKYMSNE